MSHPALRPLAAGMEVTIEFGGDPQDVTITAWGVADVAGLRRLSAELKADPRYRAGLSILAVYSDLDMSGLSDLELAQVATESVERHWDLRPAALAIVATDLKTFARAREGVAHLGGSQEHRRAFTSLDAAVAWLREQSS